MRFSKAVDIAVLKTVEDCDAALAQPLVILFKHSLSCPVSEIAKEAVSSYQEAELGAPVFMLHVQRRDLAQYVATATGVTHASPQIIVIRNGDFVGTLSHYGITSNAIAALVKA
ncbi:MAG: thioredoxin family protein [Acidobacteriota bacterium]|nr:thioredoxin family protein [Acidobacteriota bacterium]